MTKISKIVKELLHDLEPQDFVHKEDYQALVDSLNEILELAIQQ